MKREKQQKWQQKSKHCFIDVIFDMSGLDFRAFDKISVILNVVYFVSFN